MSTNSLVEPKEPVLCKKLDFLSQQPPASTSAFAVLQNFTSPESTVVCRSGVCRAFVTPLTLISLCQVPPLGYYHHISALKYSLKAASAIFLSEGKIPLSPWSSASWQDQKVMTLSRSYNQHQAGSTTRKKEVKLFSPLCAHVPIQVLHTSKCKSYISEGSFTLKDALFPVNKLDSLAYAVFPGFFTSHCVTAGHQCVFCCYMYIFDIF